MPATDAARAYFEAWNAHDGAAVAAAFAPGGTYTDPAVPDGVAGEALAGYVAMLAEAFPDLCFEPVESRRAGEDLIVAEWLMRGTNTGPFHGAPPTEQTIALPGTDVIRLAEDGLASVHGYFDRQALFEQLGLQVIVQPPRIGDAAFGYAVRLPAGRDALPGAVSVTSLRSNTAEDADESRQYARRIMREDLSRLPSFLGTVVGQVGERLFTVTAWESADGAREIADSPAHREAVERLYEHGLGQGGWTAVYRLERDNGITVRCGGCGRIVFVEPGREENCACGAALPEAGPYW